MRLHRLLFLTVLTAFPPIVTAATIQPCSPGSMNDYVGVFQEGCTVGNARFFGFTGFLSPSEGFDKSRLLIVPVDEPGSPGLEFLLNQRVNFLGYVRISFGFSVEVLPGANPIFEATSNIVDSSTFKSGTIQLTEFVCNGVFFGFDCFYGTNSFPLTSHLGTYNTHSGFARFPQQSRFDVGNDWVIETSPGGTTDANAFFGGAVLQFNEVPEPGTGLLVVAALAIFGLRRAHLSQSGAMK